MFVKVSLLYNFHKVRFCRFCEFLETRTTAICFQDAGNNVLFFICSYFLMFFALCKPTVSTKTHQLQGQEEPKTSTLPGGQLVSEEQSTHLAVYS